MAANWIKPPEEWNADEWVLFFGAPLVVAPLLVTGASRVGPVLQRVGVTLPEGQGAISLPGGLGGLDVARLLVVVGAVVVTVLALAAWRREAKRKAARAEMDRSGIGR